MNALLKFEILATYCKHITANFGLGFLMKNLISILTLQHRLRQLKYLDDTPYWD